MSVYRDVFSIQGAYDTIAGYSPGEIDPAGRTGITFYPTDSADQTTSVLLYSLTSYDPLAPNGRIDIIQDAVNGIFGPNTPPVGNTGDLPSNRLNHLFDEPLAPRLVKGASVIGMDKIAEDIDNAGPLEKAIILGLLGLSGSVPPLFSLPGAYSVFRPDCPLTMNTLYALGTTILTDGEHLFRKIIKKAENGLAQDLEALLFTGAILFFLLPLIIMIGLAMVNKLSIPTVIFIAIVFILLILLAVSFMVDQIENNIESGNIKIMDTFTSAIKDVNFTQAEQIMDQVREQHTQAVIDGICT